VLSMSTALAGVGASYGQDKAVRIGFENNGMIAQFRISDAARRPGT